MLREWKNIFLKQTLLIEDDKLPYMMKYLKEVFKLNESVKNDKSLYNNIHSVTSVLHYKIAEEFKKYNPRNLIDMGGVGKLSSFLSVHLTDAIIENSIDCLKLPYKYKSFNVSYSVATVEHISDFYSFFPEAERVNRLCSIHWFPCGEVAKIVEKFKTDKDFSNPSEGIKYIHPCVIPTYSQIEMIGFSIKTFISVQEHLFLLTTIYNARKCLTLLMNMAKSHMGLSQ